MSGDDDLSLTYCRSPLGVDRVMNHDHANLSDRMMRVRLPRGPPCGMRAFPSRGCGHWLPSAVFVVDERCPSPKTWGELRSSRGVYDFHHGPRGSERQTPLLPLQGHEWARLTVLGVASYRAVSGASYRAGVLQMEGFLDKICHLIYIYI